MASVTAAVDMDLYERDIVTDQEEDEETVEQEEEDEDGDDFLYMDTTGTYDPSLIRASAFLPVGSRRSVMINLACSTLGAGVLTLPYAFSRSGVVLGTLLLLVCWAASVFSIYLLALVADHTGYTSYEQMEARLFGRWLQRAAGLLMALFCYGCVVGYLVAASDTMAAFHLPDSFPAVLHGPYGRGILAFSFCILFILPLSLNRQLGSLRYASFFCVLAVIFLTLAMTWEFLAHAGVSPSWQRATHDVKHWSANTFDDATTNNNGNNRYGGNNNGGGGQGPSPQTQNHNRDAQHRQSGLHGDRHEARSGTSWWGHFAPKHHIHMVRYGWDMAVAIPLLMFSFCCQPNVLQAYSEMVERSPRKMAATSGTGLILCTLLYVVAGAAGYWEFGRQVDGNVLSDYDPNTSGFMALAFLALLLAVVLSIPLSILPTREVLAVMLSLDPVHSHVPLTVCLVVSALCIALAFPSVTAVFGLLGGFCGCGIGFVLPAAFALKSGAVTEANRVLYGATLLLLVGGGISGVVGSWISLFSG